MSEEEREPTMNASEALATWNGLLKRYGAFVKDVPRVLGAAVQVEESIRQEEGRLADLQRASAGLDAELAARRGTATAEAQRIVDAAQAEEATVRGRIAGARDELAQLEGKVSEAKALIVQGQEWEDAMARAAEIARRGRV